MKPFTTLAVALLSLIAIMQFTRFVLGWEVTINGVIVPVWLSGIAFVIVAGIAAMLWRESRTPRRG
jgi:membrane protein implicated in regulation of membrane protease activity